MTDKKEPLLLLLDREKLTLCCKCKYIIPWRTRAICESPEAPICDYVYGSCRPCGDINTDGKCPYYKKKEKKIKKLSFWRLLWRSLWQRMK